jgi:hypothetical protein
MPHKRKPKQASPQPQASSSSRRFFFDWFSNTEAFLAEALARADASSEVAGGGTPPQPPSPLLEALPLLSAVLGPKFRRLDQAFATIDPKFLNFESDGNNLEEERVSPPPPARSTLGDSGAQPLNPDAFEVPAGASLHPQDEDAQLWGHVLLDAETERMRDAVDVTLYPPPPAPYTVGAPGASLWNPDVDVVSIDTIHPQDMPLVADVLSLSCVITQRMRDIAHRHADNTHDTFVDKPYRLDENFSQPMPPPSPGTEARVIFPAQPPHVVEREVRAVKHMLLMAGHWLTTVDVLSVPLSEQQGLYALAASTFSVVAQRFPNAQVHEQSCPLFHEANSTPHPPFSGVGTASGTGSPIASGSGPNGPSSPPQARRPCKRRPVKRWAAYVARLHRTCWRAVVRVHCLLTYYRPPCYGMGSLLYWLLGGCALWPGWMGWVTIRPILFGGYGPL